MTTANKILRRWYNFVIRKRLKNKNFSIIADNCNGCCITHDLGCRYNSPFVNLWIDPKDYIKLLSNLKYYLDSSENMTFIDNEATYPVGLLGGEIKLYFMHYETPEEAYNKWMERKDRIIWDNLFVIFSDRNGCTLEDLIEFDNLPYKNKVVFVHKKYPNIKSSFFFKDFQHNDEVGVLLEFKNKMTWKKYYDEFDYVRWINNSR